MASISRSPTAAFRHPYLVVKHDQAIAFDRQYVSRTLGVYLSATVTKLLPQRLREEFAWPDHLEVRICI